MYKGFSEKFVKYTITKEEINPKIWRDDKPITTTPNWNNISITTLQINTTGDMPKSLVTQAKLSYYKRTKNWLEFAKQGDKEIEENPPKTGAELL